MEQMIKINGRLVAREHLSAPLWQEAMSHLMNAHGRAVCMCSPNAPQMYVTHRGDKFFLARVPGSGSTHHPACPSFDVDDTAAEPSDGRTVLTPSFPLFHESGARGLSGGRSHRTPTATESSDVNVSSLDTLLKQLWRRSEFNRWLPRMAGKRNWEVIRRHIEETATSISLGKQPLEDRLLLPTPFFRENAGEHSSQNLGRLSALCSHVNGRSNLALVFGIARSYQPSKFGCRIQVRHLPEVVFYIGQQLGELITKTYQFELLGLGRDNDSEVLALLLVEQSDKGNFIVSDIALLRTTSDFIPVRTSFEGQLISHLIARGRAFIRPLLASEDDSTSPVAFLTDAGTSVVPVHIALGEASAVGRHPHAWVWNPAMCALSETSPLPSIVPRTTAK